MEKPKWTVLYTLVDDSRARVFFNDEANAELLFNRLQQADRIIENNTGTPMFVPTKRPFHSSDWKYL